MGSTIVTTLLVLITSLQILSLLAFLSWFLAWLDIVQPLRNLPNTPAHEAPANCVPPPNPEPSATEEMPELYKGSPHESHAAQSIQPAEHHVGLASERTASISRGGCLQSQGGVSFNTVNWRDGMAEKERRNPEIARINTEVERRESLNSYTPPAMRGRGRVAEV